MSASPSLRVLVTGASGLIGRALVTELASRGHAVIRLVRRPGREPDEIAWDPAAGRVDFAGSERFDAVVHLAGANVGAGRWTPARRKEIRDSRVDATRVLVLALGRLAHPPGVLVSASAIGYYGDQGDQWLTEESPAGAGFLAGVCQAWEAEAEAATRQGLRVVRLRTGLVLSPQGGALAKMLPLFRLGLGGRLGSGRQWMSWITLPDLLGIIHEACTDARFDGAINAVTPEPVTNAGFTATLAAVLSRPAVLPVPAIVLRAVFGPMAGETILASIRARPARLQALGFKFRVTDLAAALRCPPPH